MASPTTSAIGITSTTAIRPEIYQLNIGSSATPADIASIFKLQRTTAAGTSTAYTPSKLDPGDPAATTIAGVTFTAEPTYTAATILFHAALNQRATHNVLFNPGTYPKAPATANNGIGLYGVNSSATPAMDYMMYFNE